MSLTNRTFQISLLLRAQDLGISNVVNRIKSPEFDADVCLIGYQELEHLVHWHEDKAEARGYARGVKEQEARQNSRRQLRVENVFALGVLLGAVMATAVCWVW